MVRERVSTDYIWAVHEAAHAVVGLSYSLPVIEVGLQRKKSWCYISMPRKLEFRPYARVFDWRRKHSVVAYAGHAAQDQFFAPPYPKNPLPLDYKEAFTFAKQYMLLAKGCEYGDEEHREFEEWARCLADARVRKFGYAIDVLAKRLVRARTLNRREILETVNGWGCYFGPPEPETRGTRTGMYLFTPSPSSSQEAFS